MKHTHDLEPCKEESLGFSFRLDKVKKFERLLDVI